MRTTIWVFGSLEGVDVVEISCNCLSIGGPKTEGRFGVM